MSKCKECGKAVSTLAKTCPNCGVPKPALKKKSKAKNNLKKKSKAKTNLKKKSKTKKELIYNPKTGSFDKISSKKIKDSNDDPYTGYNPETGSFERESKKTGEEKIWVHCRDYKCRDYTQIYKIYKSYLDFDTCTLCKSMFMEAKIRNGKPVIPTDGIYDKIQNEEKDSSEWSRTPSPGSSGYIDYMNKKNKVKTTSGQTTSGQKDIFDQFGNGTLDLATAFWGFFVFGSTILGIICGVLSEMVSAFFNYPYVLFTALIIMNTGKCAENYKQIMIKKNQSIVWGVLTQILCVISFLGLILFVYDLLKN